MGAAPSAALGLLVENHIPMWRYLAHFQERLLRAFVKALLLGSDLGGLGLVPSIKHDSSRDE